MESQENNSAVQANQWNGEMARDKCCWHCEKRSISLSCTTCFRSFHVNCLKEVDKNASQIHNGTKFECPICESLNASKAAFVGNESILELLKYTMNAILGDSDFAKLERLQGGAIVHPIDLNDIKQKIHRAGYGSLDEFLVDIECIQHNYSIWKSDDASIATRLVKFCESEVQHILSCSECYEMKYTRPNEWRTLACSKPHLLLWIKLDHEMKASNWPSKRGNSFWPAKLLSVGMNSIDTEVVNAIFFCRSDLVEIPLENCFIYNKRPSTQTRRSKDIEDPQKEVDLYIENILLKFDRIEVKLDSIKFKPHLLPKYMRDMFPGYSPLNDHDYCARIDITDSTDESDGLFSDEDKKSDTDDFSEYKSDEGEKCGSDFSDSSESDTNDESSESDVIPKKRQRLSGGIGNVTKLVTPNTIGLASINCSNDSEINLEANPSQSFEPPKIESNFQEGISQTIKHLEVLTKKRDDEINSTIQAMSQELETLKKSYADCRARNNELVERLKVASDERGRADSEAKSEVAKIKGAHVKEIMVLNKANKLKIEMLQQEKEVLRKGLQNSLDQKTIESEIEKQRATDELKKLTAEHSNRVAEMQNEIAKLQQDKNKLCKVLTACHSKFIESKQNHDRNLAEIRHQFEAQLESEQKCHSAADGKQKAEFVKQITELKEAISKLEQEEQNYRNNYQIFMLEFEKKMEKNHEKQLQDHKIELQSEKKRAEDEMKKIQLDYSRKLAELQNTLETAIEGKSDAEAQLKIKCDELSKYKARMKRAISVMSGN